uniref:Uncharacterized protein n=1 Tax=Chromera velia CCMP2878 TaxID=1169474 RepID=A0A0G4GX32_9ALVE|eukprot:Cvel_5339.t1-p1 / transcript=Cvel_5339.t1 / gene=Cvel_5339 / organism=Chromera_velia_CCMP2878 / gene_product=hypothetical protein / transcript_product=hypothetical protein / location=Cvel_scaffold247:86150-86974(+) / protein_length=154 / sequence_SO=supercontig / SO=protein_coding / is_pseudo=false
MNPEIVDVFGERLNLSEKPTLMCPPTKDLVASAFGAFCPSTPTAGGALRSVVSLQPKRKGRKTTPAPDPMVVRAVRAKSVPDVHQLNHHLEIFGDRLNQSEKQSKVETTRKKYSWESMQLKQQQQQQHAASAFGPVSPSGASGILPSIVPPRTV